MVKGVRIRVYPNKKQRILINKTFGCTRLIYNLALAYRIESYENDKTKINYSDTNVMLTQLKKEEEYNFLNEVDSMSLQQTLRDLNSAFKHFFKDGFGYPKYKSKRDYNCSYRTQNNKSRTGITVTFDGKHVKLPKLGTLKSKCTIDVSEGNILNATIERTPSNKYYVVLCVNMPTVNKKNKGNIIGIDVGLKDFLIDSDGNKVSNRKFLRKNLKKLKKEQKRFSHVLESHIVDYKTIGNKRYPIYDKKILDCKNLQKQRIKVAKISEHIVNQRNDFLQKLTTKLVSENQVISLEDLNVKGMTKNHHLAMSICDASWSKFKTMLEYKAKAYDTSIVYVPRFFASSQTCNCCGYKNADTKNLKIRKWTCPNCNTTHDRDINAAINIKNKGLEILNSK